jgi:hypothetical protein
MAKPKKKNNKQDKFQRPPYMSYDPALEAERRSLKRGLGDVLFDTRRARRYARKDWRLSRSDLLRERGRGYEDISRRYDTESRELGYRGADIQQQAERGREDFSTQLTNLIRTFQTQGREQMQAQNAAGVLGGSTGAAAAARRAENLGFARAPIDTGRQRLEEDTSTAVGRLGVARTQLGSDTALARTRLAQDFAHNLRLGKIDLHRTLRDLYTKRQRARREATIGDVDITQQEIFGARQLHPKLYGKYGRKRR